MIPRCAASEALVGGLDDTFSDEVILEELTALKNSGQPFQQVFADSRWEGEPWGHDLGEIKAVIESSQANGNNKTLKSNNRSESGRKRFLRQLLSLFQTCSRRNNPSGEQKGCFMKTKTSLIRNSMNRSPLRCSFLLIALMLACFGLSPQAQALCQEGCFGNRNTALGDDALSNNTTFGENNTAIGFHALFSNTSGDDNTAVGRGALSSNTLGYLNTAIGFYALRSKQLASITRPSVLMRSITILATATRHRSGCAR
jgi:hypothetical protein